MLCAVAVMAAAHNRRTDTDENRIMTNFGKDFFWGAATASYQIEGARHDGGRRDSIWDTFSHSAGAVAREENGDIACDHYHRWKEDLGYLQELGCNTYRFSLAWPRILPFGTGRINRAGADFYSKIIDTLLESGITPFVTLYHWDLPQVLQDRGGFLNPEIAEWFSEYAQAVVKLYGDRVKHFITINEPQCVLDCGYRQGVHAPGLKVSLREQLTALHNLLRAHGCAARELKTIRNAEVGYSSCGTAYAPISDTKEDFDAAYERTFSYDANSPLWSTSAYADPVFFGKYPKEWYEISEEYRPEITDEDMEVISTPLDFFGLNIYHGKFVRAKCGISEELPAKTGGQKTLMGWDVTPEVMYWAPHILYKRYGKKIYVTENGMSCPDTLFSDGKVHDTYRQEYI